MKLYNILYLAVAVSFAACSGESKKVVVMASGKIAQNGDNITLTPGTTHNEVTFDASSDKITVTSPAGNKEFDLKESGLYLLNLKKDTLAVVSRKRVPIIPR